MDHWQKSDKAEREEDKEWDSNCESMLVTLKGEDKVRYISNSEVH